MSRANLLIEIGTEELPPGLLPGLAEDLGSKLLALLAKANLEPGQLETFAAPRRLAVRIHDLLLESPAQEITKLGPPVAAGTDQGGNPTPAGAGFARSCGVEFSALQEVDSDKGMRLAYTQTKAGATAASLVPELFRSAVDGLVVPRRMRWGAGEEEFVRPVHWLLALLGNEVIPTELWGIRAQNQTCGHRFHAPGMLQVNDALDYEEVLEQKGFVIPSFQSRKARIQGQLDEMATQLGVNISAEEDLLDEVTALVEWPVAVHGSFEERFLAVPQEALVSTMCANQKYFPVYDDSGVLQNLFVTISNIESKDPAQIRQGNERVIRPRFADAEFFYLEDQKKKLSTLTTGLDSLTFEKTLGSVGDRARRLTQLAPELSAQMGADEKRVSEAAALCKNDLLTLMVQEFPKLQGIMGRYYALHEGADPEVAAAIEEHYLPRHASDGLPGSATGRVLALLDRLDLLAGFFAINKQPTGDKDPFGLRRAALGVIRIVLDAGVSLDVLQALESCVNALPAALQNEQAAAQAAGFVMQRLEIWLAGQGTGADVLQSVAALEVHDIQDFVARVEAITAFRQMSESADLAAANKRVANILSKSGGDDDIQQPVDEGLLEGGAEAELFRQIQSATEETRPLLAARDYVPYLEALAGLRPAINEFFDQVMVNAEDAAIRLNRLRLLHSLRELFLGVGDVSFLQTAAGK